MRKLTLPSRAVAFTLLAFSGGCGAGIPAIVESTDSSSSSSNAPPSISELRIENPEVPGLATLVFTLADRESDPAMISFSYAVPSDPVGQDRPMEQIPVNPASFDSTGIGVPHPVPWNFAAESELPDDGSFVDGVTVIVRVSGSTTQMIENIGLGNDPPEVLPPFVLDDLDDDGEVGGIVGMRFTIADSSSDVLDIEVEYNDDGANDFPDGSWFPAREAAISDELTPTLTFEGVEALPDPGRELTFFWDTNHDSQLHELERDVKLRITPDDRTRDEHDNPIGVGEPLVTKTFRVDNNEEPIVLLEEGSFLINDDALRGIPVRYRLVDEESNDVQVLFQWRRSGQDFPPLDQDDDGHVGPDDLEAIQSDERLRAELQVCDLYPSFARGSVEPRDERHVRLPELAAGGSALLARREVEGLPIALLRSARIPAPLAAGWSQNPLQSPVAALPVDEGLSAVVLEGSGGWHLRMIELATGAIAREIASGPDTPTALAFEAGEESVLLASTNGGAWRVERAELETGVVTLLVTSDALDASPDRQAQPIRRPADRPAQAEGAGVRALNSLGPHAALATVGDALLRLDWSDPGQPRAAAIVRGLSTPWGLALDPRREGLVYVAERDAPTGQGTGRVRAVDVDTRRVETVAATTSTGVDPFPAPTALALEGKRLLVSCQPAGSPTRELRSLELGGRDGTEVSTLAELPEAASIAAGPESLLLIALPMSGDLAAGGGVEQVRTVVNFDLVTRTVEVSEAFDPEPLPNQPWRLRSDPYAEPRSGSPQPGTPGVFAWDTRQVGGQRVFVRALALDDELGLIGESSTAKEIDSGFLAPQVLGGAGVTDLPRSVVSADVDGDGRLDVVVANGASETLSVFYQDESGDFGAVVTLGDPSTTPDPQAVIAVDLDGDGDTDIVSANGTGDALAVFFQEAGSFPASPLVVDGSPETDCPFALAAADVNGDGALDLLTANGSSSTLSVFFQDAPGSFAGAPLVLGGPGVTDAPFSITAADLDANGRTDIVSANGLGNTLSVFLQSASGSFPAAPLQLGGSRTEFPRSVLVADVNGDGLQDLVSSNLLSNSLTVFFQPVDGLVDGMAPDIVLGDSNLTEFPFAVVATDVDGDGDLDLASANGFGNTLTVFSQLSPARFDEVPLELGGPAVTDGPQSLAAADLDGDGRVDLVSANSFGNTLTTFRHTSRQRASGPTVLGGTTITAEPSSVVAADMDGDGDLDVVSSNAANDRLTIFHQTAAAAFDPLPREVGGPGITDAPSSVVAADLDGNGALDLVSANEDGEDLTVFLQKENGDFFLEQTLGDPACTGRPSSVVAADLDGDGLLDLASANFRTNNLAIFLKEASGSFAATPVCLASVDTGGPTCVVAGDVNADGLLDLVSSNGLSDTLTVFLQPAQGGFDPALVPIVVEGASLNGAASVALADVNGDGDLDLVSLAPLSFSLNVFEQDSEARPIVFDESTSLFVWPNRLSDHGAATAADLDGDGDVDLAAVGFSSTVLDDGTDVFDSVVSVFYQVEGGFPCRPHPFGVCGPGLELTGGLGTTEFLSSLVTVDVDGDGDLDFVAGDRTTDKVVVFWGGR